ncbi:MAG TPA: DUF3037 domain-containing protein [Pyrinomonadaceae bacterium]|nr:DUF3037 domain-containing protein [Pyrinomonadaceae bacterium]
MREKQLFEYAVIRLVPCVEREEFLNVGVIVYCPPQDFLQTAFELNEERLRLFAHDLKISEIEEHLLAFERICAGGPEAGAIGKLPMGERFRWLTAPRSTVVQTSPVHTGLCLDARETLVRLLANLVQ